jgi:hypothetical protein
MVLLPVVVAVTAACSVTGHSDRDGDVWAGNVDRWLRNSQAALRAGIPNLSAFLSPDVVIDHSGTAEGHAVGRDAALSLYRVLQLRDPDRALRLPAYVSPAGAVVLSHWALPPPVRGQDAALAMTFSAAGLQRQESALSVDSGRRRLATWRTGALARDWRPLEVIADRYVSAWSEGDRGAATALYDSAVAVHDRLQGMRVDGLGSVLRRLDTTTDMQLDRLPNAGGPAVFGVTTPLRDSFDQAVLLVTVNDDGNCPGHVAVVLELGPTGKVTSEERYHRLDDARRCLDPSGRPGGWWDRLNVPAPIPLERTGSVRAGRAVIEIWNGTAELRQLIGWALDRYTHAGMPLPRPESITFYPAAPEQCSGYAGLASGPRLTEINLCFGAEQACPRGTCPPWSERSRHLVLHELAHTWMSQYLDDARRQRYVEAVDMRWWDRDDPWDRRAIERAAETIAWGLDAERAPVREFGSPSDERLAEEFRLLTAADPP